MKSHPHFLLIKNEPYYTLREKKWVNNRKLKEMRADHFGVAELCQLKVGAAKVAENRSQIGYFGHIF